MSLIQEILVLLLVFVVSFIHWILRDTSIKQSILFSLISVPLIFIHANFVSEDYKKISFIIIIVLGIIASFILGKKESQG